MNLIKAFRCWLGFHPWGEWKHDRIGSCEQRRGCSYCKLPQTQIEHIWSDPEYISVSSCEKRIICCRCGFEQFLGRFHPSGPPGNSGPFAEQICSRCNEHLNSFISA